MSRGRVVIAQCLRYIAPHLEDRISFTHADHGMNCIVRSRAMFVVLLSLIGCLTIREGQRAPEFEPFPYPIHSAAELQWSYNADSSYVVRYVVLNKSKTATRRHIRFAIHDTKSGAILFSDELDDASLSWRNANELEVEHRPGIIPAEDEFNEYLHGYIYHVQSRTKIPRRASIPHPDSK